MGVSDIRKHCDRRAADLESEFSQFKDHASDLQNYFLPWHGRNLSDNSSNSERNGSRKQQYLYDPTPTVAVEAVAAGMYGGLTSPSRPWFNLSFADPALRDLYSVRVWLDEVEERVRSVLSRSNVYQALRHCFMELVTFGTWACAILDDESDIVRAENYTFGEYQLAQNDAHRVDVFYRKFRATVRQCVQWWGLDKVGDDIKNMWENGRLEQYVTICHLVEPNTEDIKVQEAKGKPFRSFYWCKEKSFQLLEVSGFHEFPILAPRWSVTGNRVYGNSPAMTCLPDNKQLQYMTKDKLVLIGKLADPPMFSQGVKMGDIDTAQGGVSFANNAGAQMGPMYVPNPSALPALSNDINILIERINRTMHVDLFRMMMDTDRRQMTAAEVNERASEKLMLLGPVVESLNHELLDPLINRVFSIMLRRGLIPPPPEEIQGMPMAVEYISPLAKAQRMVGINADERFLSFAGSLASIRPEVLDKVNADEMLSDYADRVGLKQKILHDDEYVQRIRQQRAAAAQEERAMAMEREAAEGAKTLSETQVGPEQNLLSGLIG